MVAKYTTGCSHQSVADELWNRHGVAENEIALLVGSKPSALRTRSSLYYIPRSGNKAMSKIRGESSET